MRKTNIVICDQKLMIKIKVLIRKENKMNKKVNIEMKLSRVNYLFQFGSEC